MFFFLVYMCHWMSCVVIVLEIWHDIYCNFHLNWTNFGHMYSEISLWSIFICHISNFDTNFGEKWVFEGKNPRFSFQYAKWLIKSNQCCTCSSLFRASNFHLQGLKNCTALIKKTLKLHICSTNFATSGFLVSTLKITENSWPFFNLLLRV